MSGVIVFREHLSVLNVVGFLICQAGIVDYVVLRYSNFTDEDEEEELGYNELVHEEDEMEDVEDAKLSVR